MNILILDSWLKEHLKTKASVKQIGEYLSLCSQSVEKIDKAGNDWLYDIEITTNRPDCLSVYGLARELAVILPRFNLPAKLLSLETKHELNKSEEELPLEVKITKPSLCPRFTALIFDKVVIKPSPKIVQERLEKSGIRAINNVVDISNYLMLELGSPMHTFDYDKIKGQKMILRESAGGEKITTLDGQVRPLPDGTIIIEDGQGRIIDLCGIMGGENSQVDNKTKRVLLFVQTYDPVKIRQACQKLTFRTDAASRFEKGVDPEGVMMAMNKAIQMFVENCEAKIASNLIDIYPNLPKTKTVDLKFNHLQQIMGIEIPQKEVISILESLGFKIISSSKETIHCSIPHWRDSDINLPEDLIEEIARIYGYHHLPNNLLPTLATEEGKDNLFEWTDLAKEALKFWGFTETINYSMVSEQLLKNWEIQPVDCLRIANPLSDEWVYLRTSLIPSLLEVIKKNKPAQAKIFEMGNIYLSQSKDQLPEENLMLSGLLVEENFAHLKGFVESLLEEMGIVDYKINPYELQKTFYGKIFHDHRRAEVTLEKTSLGIFGEIKKNILERLGIKQRIFVFDLDFNESVKYANHHKRYLPIPKYPPIIEDLSFVVPGKTYVGKIMEMIKTVNPIIKSVDLIDSYEQTRTFRVTYQDLNKTLTDKEVEKLRKEIISKLKNKFGLKLKGKKED
jgi:phenylalanyl-tRNA synthetase beta chain